MALAVGADACERASRFDGAVESDNIVVADGFEAYMSVIVSDFGSADVAGGRCGRAMDDDFVDVTHDCLD